MRLGKKLKRAFGAPGRHYRDIKLKSFAFGYSVVAKQFDSMQASVAKAANELDLGVCGSASKHFFAGKACNFFPGKASRHLYSKEELAEAKRFKRGVEALSLRLKKNEFLREDAVWLRCEFAPFLERFKQGDLRRLQHGFRFEKGVPIGEEGED